MCLSALFGFSCVIPAFHVHKSDFSPIVLKLQALSFTVSALNGCKKCNTLHLVELRKAFGSDERHRQTAIYHTHVPGTAATEKHLKRWLEDVFFSPCRFYNGTSCHVLNGFKLLAPISKLLGDHVVFWWHYNKCIRFLKVL